MEQNCEVKAEKLPFVVEEVVAVAIVESVVAIVALQRIVTTSTDKNEN